MGVVSQFLPGVSQVFPMFIAGVLFFLQGFPSVFPEFPITVVSGLSIMSATPRGCVDGLLGSCRRRFPSVK